MATAKKAPTKTAKPETKAKAPAAPKKPPEPQFSMPMEVKEWIERAQSIMNHQRGEIERLKEEVKDLKAYKKWAEHRILRSDHE
jgi:polyhydroxyalkanoate synthesis regulator phasin